MILAKYRTYPVRNGAQYFSVIVHSTLKSLRAYWDEIEHTTALPCSSRTVRAFCVMFSKPENNCIGEIVLVKSTPLDIISHECIHALLHWGRLSNLNIYHSEETFCENYQQLLKTVLVTFSQLSGRPYF